MCYTVHPFTTDIIVTSNMYLGNTITDIEDFIMSGLEIITYEMVRNLTKKIFIELSLSSTTPITDSKNAMECCQISLNNFKDTETLLKIQNITPEEDHLGMTQALFVPLRKLENVEITCSFQQSII